MQSPLENNNNQFLLNIIIPYIICWYSCVITIMELTWNSNTEITAADIPELTEEIRFYDGFNKPIGHDILPESLKSMVFGYFFDQLIGPNVLPSSLKIIKFGWSFDQQIGENVLPNSLKTIKFGLMFNQYAKMFCLIP